MEKIINNESFKSVKSHVCSIQDSNIVFFTEYIEKEEIFGIRIIFDLYTCDDVSKFLISGANFFMDNKTYRVLE